MTEDFMREWPVLVRGVVPHFSLSPFPVQAKKTSVSSTVVAPPHCIPFPAYTVIGGSINWFADEHSTTITHFLDPPCFLISTHRLYFVLSFPSSFFCWKKRGEEEGGVLLGRLDTLGVSVLDWARKGTKSNKNYCSLPWPSGPHVSG